MDAETQSKIFDPFFSTKFAGRGLGMAAVMGIMRSHRGAIKVNTTVGKGTVIRVLFPKTNKPNMRATHLPSEESIIPINGKVLVIDDEEMARTVAQKILQKFGFTVLTAHNGREGLEIFKQHRDQISVVLLDMTMPIMSGVNTLQGIRKLRSDIPVVLSSGYDENEAFTKFCKTSASTFLQKPYQPIALIEKLNEVLKS
jgi:CheY-like chemotaxis protein